MIDRVDCRMRDKSIHVNNVIVVVLILLLHLHSRLKNFTTCTYYTHAPMSQFGRRRHKEYGVLEDRCALVVRVHVHGAARPRYPVFFFTVCHST